MSYLNWKEALIQTEVSPHVQLQTQLKVTLRKKEVQVLVSCLEDVFFHSKGELRVTLSSHWILFWKVREEGSRALLAHPQAEDWVATFALEVEFGRKWIAGLQTLGPNQSLALSQLGSLISMSNLDLVISVCPQG